MRKDICIENDFSPDFVGQCSPDGWLYAIHPLTCTHFDPIKFAFWTENSPLQIRPINRILTLRVAFENWHTGGHGASLG